MIKISILTLLGTSQGFTTWEMLWDRFQPAFAYRPHFHLLEITDSQILTDLAFLDEMTRIPLVLFNRMRATFSSAESHLEFRSQLNQCQSVTEPLVKSVERKFRKHLVKIKSFLWCLVASEFRRDPSIVGFASTVYLSDVGISKFLIPSLDKAGYPKVQSSANWPSFRILPIPRISDTEMASTRRQTTAVHQYYPHPISTNNFKVFLSIGTLPDRSPSVSTRSKIDAISPERRLSILDMFITGTLQDDNGVPESREYLQYTISAAFMEIDVFQILAKCKWNKLPEELNHLCTASSIVTHLQSSFDDGRYHSITPEYIYDWFYCFKWESGIARMDTRGHENGPWIELPTDSWRCLLEARKDRLTLTGYESVQ